MAVLVLFSTVLLVSTPLAARAPAFVYRELYIACYLMKSLVFLQFWLLAGDLLDIRESKRLFPVLLGFSLMGGLAASVAASLLPQWGLPTETLLTAAAIILLSGIIPVHLVSRRWPARFPARQEKSSSLASSLTGLRSDLRVALSSSLLRTLSLSMLLLALLAQVLDFLMGKAAYATLTRVDALTSFYAVLNAVVIGTGTLVQFTLANRIISSLGVTKGQLLAPLTFLGGFLAISAVWLAGGEQMAGSFFVAVLASRAIQKVLRISIVRTSTDLVFNAIPSERRGRAKAFKETVIEPLGVLVGGALLVLGTAMPMQYLLLGALGFSAVFLALTLHLKDDYLDSLVHVLKEKSRFRFALPSIMMRAVQPRHAPASVTGLRHALQNDEASVRLLAVELAAGLKEPEAASLLVKRFQQEKDTDVRARMLSALGKMVHRQHDPPEQDGLEDQDPLVRASGMASIAETGIFKIEDVTRRPDPRSKEPIEAEATPPRTEVMTKTATREYFLDLARSGEHDALERLTHYLDEGDGATRHLAARALEGCGDAAIGVLTLALWSADVEGRRYVIRALGRIGTETARQALLPVLSLEAQEAYYDLVRLEAIGHLPESPSVALLEDSIAQRVERAKRNAHQVLRSVFMGEPGMRLILSNLNHPDRYVRSSAIEALEVRVDPTLLGGTLPLFEHESPHIVVEHGSSQFELPRRSPLEVLSELTRHRSPWVRACAVYATGWMGSSEAMKSLLDRLADSNELVRLNAIEAIGRLGGRDSLQRLEAMKDGADERTRHYAETATKRIRTRA